jgi:isoquinoline 1-oxidoreductase beta subunit
MRVPVRLQWTREDDIQHDYFHSVAMQRIEAGLDASANVVAYRTRIAFPPISSTFKAGEVRPPDGELGQGVLDTPLTIPNVKAESCEAPPHVRIGWLRSVHNIHHAFAMCSFVDELAHVRGVDPKEQWLSLLGPARLVTEAELGVKKVPNYGAKLTDNPIDTARYARVLERVTSMAGWKARHGDPNRGYGLAVHRSFLSYIAVVAAVVKAPTGKLKVDEAWMVADAGVLVNPERVKSQLEGAFVFGTSLTFFSQITAKRGAITQTNFRDYRLARIADAPRAIHTELIDSNESSGGVGEPGVPPVAPAIVNAVFALTGVRHRVLPLANAGVV